MLLYDILKIKIYKDNAGAGIGHTFLLRHSFLVPNLVAVDLRLWKRKQFVP